MDINTAYDIARDGALFLARIVRKYNGKFVYQYDHRTRVQAKKYNILRHCGCVWAMLDVFQDTQDQEVLDAAGRALRFLTTERMIKGPHGWMVHENYQCKMGGNALAILALLKHYEITGKQRHLDLASGIARYIRHHVDDDGQLTRHKVFLPRNEDTGFVSEYYPGEAILALAELWNHTGDRDDLVAAVSVTEWLHRTRDAGLMPLQDHWLLQGLEKLGTTQELSGSSFFSDYAEMLAETIFYGKEAYMKAKRSAPLACRSEGLLSYVSLTGDTAAMPFIEELLDLQQTLQITAGEDKGAFLDSAGGTTIRNDYTQHNISAFIRYARLMRAQQTADQKVAAYG